MLDFLQRPLVVFAIAVVVLWLAVRVGALFQRARPLDKELREDFNVVLAASLTLLGLLIGFGFSMASNRYDQRKVYEEAEANAIGTEYVRADLLPATDAAKVRDLLRKYTDQRVLYYTAHASDLAKIDAETSRLQNELWLAVLGPASQQPTPIVALAVAGMNDVLNSQGYTTAAWRNRIPGGAWALLVTIAIMCNAMVGYATRGPSIGAARLLILPFVGAVAFTLIKDIDTPRRGLIHVAPQNLISLKASLSGSPS